MPAVLYGRENWSLRLRKESGMRLFHLEVSTDINWYQKQHDYVHCLILTCYGLRETTLDIIRKHQGCEIFTIQGYPCVNYCRVFHELCTLL